MDLNNIVKNFDRVSAIMDRTIAEKRNASGESANRNVINESSTLPTANTSLDSDYGSFDESTHPNMPKAILESFKQNPIEIGEMKSSLDNRLEEMTRNVDINYLDKKPSNRNSRNVNESPYPQSSSIDYSLINTMIKQAVEDALEKRFGGIEDISILRIDKSDIQFVTNNGTVFKGKMKKVGNLNEK